MSGEGIRADAVVEGLVGDGVDVLQYGVVSLTKQGIHVVRDEHPSQSVPCHEHHVLGTAIHAHEVIRNQIPCKRSVVHEVLIVLREELLRVALAAYYPRPQSLYRRLVVLMGGAPGGVRLESELQRIVEASEVVGLKQTDGLRVVQEFQADALIALTAQRRLVVVSLDALEAVDDG